MVNRNELRDWINGLSQDSCIGIDEGGLCLHEIAPDNTLTGCYYEIGGIPEAIENACTGPCTVALMPGEVCKDCGKVCPEDEEPPTNTPDCSRCQNCGMRWLDSALKEIHDFWGRVSPGEPMPSGECPECGALCQPCA